MNVFLDDIRTPKMSHNSNKGLGDKYDWVIIRDFFEFVKFVKENFDQIEIISFDHDIASYANDREYTGKDAADYLIKYCLDNDEELPSWYVHSDNTVGKENIIKTILSYLRVIEGYKSNNFRYYHSGIINGKEI